MTDGAISTAAISTHAICPATHQTPPPLTSSETAARILSSPSTSCLKVGRCEGTACQHSRINMYLGAEGGVSGVLPCPPPALPGWYSQLVGAVGGAVHAVPFL